MASKIHPIVAGLCVVIELVIFIFNHLVKAYTVLGRMTLDEIEGLKMYLRVAEKDRLNLENPPERTPEHFEEFLPFALALGVDQQWAEQFHDVLASVRSPGDDSRENTYSPSFYQGDNGGFGVGAVAATAAIASTLGANLSAASVSPSSSGGGSYSSGGYSGGGGSSGGGGGGGGGGGW